MRLSPSPRALATLIAILLLVVSSAPPITASVPPPASTTTPAAFSCDNVTEIFQSDCEALVAFYNGTDGPHWTDNTGWLQTNTPCSWFGVLCYRWARVGELRLDHNRLRGPIPPELGNLTAMGGLDLTGNQLSGPIPPELAGLTELGSLILSSNQLSGPIPPQLGSLQSLQALRLDHNQLSGPIPPRFDGLYWLSELSLDQNELSGPVPPELGSLGHLGVLGLSNNPLSGPLPTKLSDLQLFSFYYDQTDLCEPGDAAFHTWLGSINDVRRTAYSCGYVTVTGLVWNDANRNRIQDAGESGLAGVAVTLVATQTTASVDAGSRRVLTDHDGRYRFDYVVMGPHSVTAAKPGYRPTTRATTQFTVPPRVGQLMVSPIGMAPPVVFLPLTRR